MHFLKQLFRLLPGKSSQPFRPALPFKPKLDRLEERLAPAANLFAVGSPAGALPLVKLYDSDTGTQVDQVQPFNSAYTGGVEVTLADLNRDGTPEILAAASSGTPHVVVLDGKTHAVTASFYAFAPGQTSGISLAGGDIGNGSRGIVVGSGGGMTATVSVFSTTGELLRSFQPYGSSFQGAVDVALGFAENGNAAIFTAAGLGAGPHVQTIEARSGTVLSSFFAYAPEFTGGVSIAAADLNNDGVSEIITGSGIGANGHVRVFSRAGNHPLASFLASDSPASFATRVASPSADRILALVDQNGQRSLKRYSVAANGSTQEVGNAVNLGAFAIATPTATAKTRAYDAANPTPNLIREAYADTAAPASQAGAGMYSGYPIRYGDGSPEIDIALAGPGLEGSLYGDFLGYTNQLSYTNSQHFGIGWFSAGSPSVVEEGGYRRVLLSPSEIVTFPIGSGTLGGKIPPPPPLYGETDKLYTDATNNIFIFIREDGTSYEFFDFSSTHAALKQGTLSKIKDPAGNVLLEAKTWDGSGRVTTLEKSVTQNSVTTLTKRTLTYITSGVNSGLISQVDFAHKTGSGSWVTDRTALMDYYSGTGDSAGTDNELKMITVQDGSSNVLDRSYFRYWLSGQTNGYNQALKFVLKGESYNRMVQAGLTPTTATNTQLAGYADHYFEYDDQFRVTLENTNAFGSYGFAYTTNPNGLSTSDFNYWNVKTVETLPDGNQNIVYTNFQKQAMVTAFNDVSASAKWITYTQFNSKGYVTLKALPSAMSGYNDSYNDLAQWSGGNATYIKDGEGLVLTNTYASSTTATSTSAGDAKGWLSSSSLSRGETGTAVPQSAVTYIKRTLLGVDYFFPANQTVYTNTNGTGSLTTSYSYTFQGSTAQPDQITQTNPTVSTGKNGSNSATSSVTVYDAYGLPIWTKDEAGFLTYRAYDQVTGALTKQIVDVDTTQTTTYSNLPSGWSTPSGAGLHLTTSYEVDNLGRTTKITYPNGRIDYIVYKDDVHEVRTYPAWDATNNVPLLPITVTREDQARGYREVLTMSATPSVTSGRPTGAESISSLESLTREVLNSVGQVTATDQYFYLTGLTYSASSVTLGTAGTNYYRTEYGYDSKGNRVRTLSPTGTITRTVLDDLNRVSSVWVGLDDTPTSGTWSPTNTTGTDLVKVTENEYDGGGVGDSNLTKVTQIPGGSAANRVTQYFLDWRNRVVATKAGVETSEATDTNRLISYVDYDNLNRVTTTRLYDGDTVSITSTSGVPNAPSSSLLRAKSETQFDERGQAYKTLTYNVDPSTGSVSASALVNQSWFDPRGLVIKQSSPGGVVTKITYDGAARPTASYTTDGGGDSAYTDADDVTGDAVLQQVETTYDSNSHAILVTAKQRFHDETGTGALGTATTGVKARVSYAASYYDGADRLTNTVDVGTNGGSSYTRPSSVPSRSDTVLVVTTAYNSAGLAWKVTDSKGIESRSYFDALGRVTKTIENYVDGVVSDTDDKTTESTYNAVGLTTVKVVLPSSGQQVTEWVYGVTTGGGSGLNSNDLVKEVRYPDPSTGASSSSSKDLLTVNALGQALTMNDRNGTVHTYSYDVVGRQTADAITTLGSGVDGTVRRLTTAYDTQGNPYLFTAYDASSGGNIVNQVKRDFNGLGQLTSEWQSHSGAVTGSSPRVQYAYSEMPSGANHSRLTSVTYASGYTVNYNYASGLDANISRLSSLSDASNTLEAYSYLGLGTVVKRAHAQSGVDLSYIKLTGESVGDAGDQYTGLDRFGRIVDQRWINSSNIDVDRYQYGYDRDGNRLYKDNKVIASLSEVYTYDSLNQLASYKLGTLNGTKTDVTGSPSNSQSWDYDGVGNWDSITTNSTTQTRTANKQNEITAVSGATTPTYDSNGNLTTDENNYRFVYDAWNKVVQVKNSSNVVIVSYGRDALQRHVTDTVSSTVTDRFFSSDWQLLETKTGSNTVTRNVWSPVYVDGLVLRDRDTDANGTLDERLYSLQDANWNTTALVNTSGTAQERYTYTPFGQVTFRDSSGSTLSNSAKDWIFLHQGGEEIAAGDYEFRNRVYSPTLGRWLSNDPLGFKAGDQNWYRALENNLGNGLDPSGLDLFYLLDPIAILGNGHAGMVIGPITPPEFLLDLKDPPRNYIRYLPGTVGKLEKNQFYYFYISVAGLNMSFDRKKFTWENTKRLLSGKDLGLPYVVDIRPFKTNKPDPNRKECTKLPVEILEAYPRYKAFCALYSNETSTAEFLRNAGTLIYSRQGYMFLKHNCAIFILKCIKPDVDEDNFIRPRPNTIFEKMAQLLEGKGKIDFYYCNNPKKIKPGDPNVPLIKYLTDLYDQWKSNY